ncbi:MAG: metalloregulator ArsR/SmtB family transcription factor [Methanosarcinaceae archaeon]|nr:metalloregulator ArsR/SmtB family transcription factor [Methanosarcinaceae archaeon]
MSEKKLLEIRNSYFLSEEILESVEAAMSKNVDKMVSLFKVLSDPTRLRILKALEIQSLCVCVLVELTSCKPSALSYHLKLLKEAKLINSRRERNFQIYYLTEFGLWLLQSLKNDF